MPKMMPVRAEMMKARTTELGEMMAVMEVKLEMIWGMMMPSSTPMSPPMSERRTASTMNCVMMSLFLAPRARRRPISRVRSVTVASMMFMMPMPPTRSEMAAMEPRTMLNIFCVCSDCLRSWSGTVSLKSWTLWVRFRRLVIWVSAVRTAAGEFICMTSLWSWMFSAVMLPAAFLTMKSP